MIGFGEGDEGFGVAEEAVELFGVVDANGLIAGSVHEEDVDVFDGRKGTLHVEGFEFGEEFFCDDELASGEGNFRAAVLADLVDFVFEEVKDMHWFRRGGDGGDGFDAGDFSGDGEDGGSAKGMADEDLGSGEVLCHPIRCSFEVAEVGDEGGVEKGTFGAAQAGEVNSDSGDAIGGEVFGDAGFGKEVFSAGEAVGEEGVAVDFASRHFEDARELSLW